MHSLGYSIVVHSSYREVHFHRLPLANQELGEPRVTVVERAGFPGARLGTRFQYRDPIASPVVVTCLTHPEDRRHQQDRQQRPGKKLAAPITVTPQHEEHENGPADTE